MARRRMKLASGGKRFAAAIVDAVPGWILAITIVVKSMVGAMQPLVNEFSYSYYDSYQYGASGFANTFGTLIIYALGAAYVGTELFFMSRAQTIGKAILGLRVVDSKKGKPIGFGRMIFREVIVKKASQVVFYIGYIWILIDDYSRAWHDKILDTYVVDEKLTMLNEMMDERERYTSNNNNDSGSYEPEHEPLYFFNE